MSAEIVEKLKERGCRITPQRRFIIDILGEGGPLTAAEVFQRARGRYPRIGLDTVYRNLSLLVEEGVLARISGVGKEGVRYEQVSLARHHHHIVCVKCGHTACIDYCPVDSKLAALVRNQGYKLVRHHMDLYGLCGNCQP